MTAAGISRLFELQSQFTSMLRMPLDRRTGTLRATPERYDPALCGSVREAGGTAPSERLAIYHRQYWFRLFSALQNELRLGTALLGAWRFNELASQFFLAHPPRSRDLSAIADEVEPFIATTMADSGIAVDGETRTVPKLAVLEAIRIDNAHRRVAAAIARRPRLVVTPDNLPSLRLVASAAVALVDEHWPLVALRRTLPSEASRSVSLPAPSPRPRTWAIARTETGVRVVPLEPLQAQLLRMLHVHPVAEALAIVEATCDPEQREALAERVPTWLSQSLELGMWSTTSEEPS